MFKKIIIGLAVVIVIVLALAFMQPATYSVTRTIAIKAPPERIQPLISDFHHWPLWSPWEKLDPAMKRTFSGATKKSDFMTKLMGAFVSMDRMIGPDFESGLSKMKAVAEK